MAEEANGQQYDSPNKEVLGLSPPWEEGEGGPAGEADSEQQEEEKPKESAPKSKSKSKATKGGE